MTSSILEYGLTPKEDLWPSVPLAGAAAPVQISPLSAGLVREPVPEEQGPLRKCRGARAESRRADPARERSKGKRDDYRLYEEAEAVRLRTPPSTPRAAAGLAGGPPQKDSALGAAARPFAASPAESLLLPGLVVARRPHERSKSRRRGGNAEKSPQLPGSETPTVASPSLLA